MHSRTVEQVRSWDSRPFDGGLEALSALSEDGHTGAVTAAHTWLFMLNGRVIGVFEGEIEDFEASGTVYSTQDDGLPRRVGALPGLDCGWPFRPSEAVRTCHSGQSTSS